MVRRIFELYAGGRRRVPQTRAMLQRLIVARLTLTPNVATGAYAFEGRGSYGALFQGESLSRAGVSPAGFEPALPP